MAVSCGAGWETSERGRCLCRRPLQWLGHHPLTKTEQKEGHRSEERNQMSDKWVLGIKNFLCPSINEHIHLLRFHKLTSYNGSLLSWTKGPASQSDVPGEMFHMSTGYILHVHLCKLTFKKERLLHKPKTGKVIGQRVLSVTFKTNQIGFFYR